MTRISRVNGLALSVCLLDGREKGVYLPGEPLVLRDPMCIKSL